MTIQYTDYRYIFDDVDFGIAVRNYRHAQRLTQLELGEMIGYRSGVTINMIERGRMTGGLPIASFLALCQLMDANPMNFFTMEAANV